MKNIDPNTITVKRALCPFCSYGCEFGVVFNDFGIKGVEYIKGGSSDGRLCPRGSAAAMYLDHPRRLTAPTIGGKSIAWNRMVKELSKTIGNPKKVAVTFDRNITDEEYAAIIGWCNSVGIENTASTYFEPENSLHSFLDHSFTDTDLEKAKMIVVLGDLFNQAPMSSRGIIEWKMKNKKNQIVVIDSMKTHTAGFANLFLRTHIGTEPLLLLGLAREDTGDVDLAMATGIDISTIKRLSSAMEKNEKGIIFVSLPFGHTYDPWLFAEGLRRIRDFNGAKIVPFVEFAGYRGTQSFMSILDMAKKKKIKHLINFGELFPFYYPQLAADLKGVNVYATSTLKHNGYTMLPVPLNLEKQGTVTTTFGKRKLAGGIEPPSGSRTIEDILSMVSGEFSKGRTPHVADFKLDVKGRAQRIVEMSASKKKTLKLLGEKVAYNFLGFLEGERLKINPFDAEEFGIGAQDTVSVKSRHGIAHLPAKITEDVSPGVVAVPAETPGVRGLFEYELDSELDAVNFIPTEVKICRKE
jgi:hypothetical protein